MHPKNSPSGLFDGLAGHLIFLNQLYRQNQTIEIKSKMLDCIQHLNKKLEWTFRNQSLCSGTAGVFWTGLQLYKNSNEELHLKMDTGSLASMLKIEMYKMLMVDNYDYLHGAGGIIRTLAVNNLLTHEERKDLIRHFQKIAQQTPNGISWIDPFYSPGKGLMHLGIAHGVAGLINVLNCKISYGI